MLCIFCRVDVALMCSAKPFADPGKAFLAILRADSWIAALCFFCGVFFGASSSSDPIGQPSASCLSARRPPDSDGSLASLPDGDGHSPASSDGPAEILERSSLSHMLSLRFMQLPPTSRSACCVLCVQACCILLYVLAHTLLYCSFISLALLFRLVFSL